MHFAPYEIFGRLDKHIAHIYTCIHSTQVNKHNTHAHAYAYTCKHIHITLLQFLNNPNFQSGQPSLSLSSPIKEEQMLVHQSKLYHQ